MNTNINKNIKMIVNVYSQKYKNANGGGIGDFIRGSLFLIQYCIKNNLRFDIDYSNHPISKFIYKKYNKIHDKNIMYDDILYYYPDNTDIYNIEFINTFTNYINSSYDDEIIFLFSNNYPMYKITNLERLFIMEKFLPNEVMNNIINNKMAYLNLLEKQFNIIHIRLNDSIFNNDVINNNIVKKINQKIQYAINISKKNNKKILLLSNSSTIKQELNTINKNLIFDINNISHLGFSDDEESIKDTMCDMFIISKANIVFSFSEYGHGSGFSKYICELYNIPYTLKII